MSDEKICPYCRVRMTGNPRRVQCGSLECQRSHANFKERRRQENFRAVHGYSMARLYEPWHECKHCGAGYRSSNRPTSYCSIGCRNRARRVKPVLPPLPVRRAQRRLDRSAKGTAGSKPFVSGVCRRCGKPFLKRSGVDGDCCSKTCRNALRRKRYRLAHPEEVAAAHRRSKARHIAASPHYHRDKARRNTRNRLKRESLKGGKA